MTALSLPKITFGMIVLNGEPFIRHNLRALYPFAHQIIVVEGASYLAAHAATSDGHSVDGTLRSLDQFRHLEDPEHKLAVVTAEDHGYPSGFWPGEKDEQSQAYACRASGDWLWQVDVDEFYRQQDMRAIVGMLQQELPSMVFFYFKMHMYRSDLQVLGVEPEFCYCQPIPRLFEWGPDHRYLTHRPPPLLTRRDET